MLDDRACADLVVGLPTADELRLVGKREELWQQAQRRGPALGPLLAPRVRGRDASDLALIAALGLCGGKTASEALTRMLDSRRPVEARVFAALAAARPNIEVPKRLLLDLAVDARREQVMRHAARIALIARGAARELADELAKSREQSSEQRFWRSLCRAADGGAPVLAQVVKGGVVEGSLEDLARRAFYCDAIRHPGVAESKALVDLLGQSEGAAEQRLASLALGRIGVAEGVDARSLVAASPKLDVSSLLAGFDTCPPSFVSLVRRGAGGARDLETRRRFHAAAARLVPAADLAAFVDGLLQLEAAETDHAFQELARRHLDGRALEVPASTITNLRATTSVARLFVALCLADQKPSAEEFLVLGPRVTTALAALRRGDLGTNEAEGRRALYATFVSEHGRGTWSPGSWTGALDEELAMLSTDLFVGGAGLSGALATSAVAPGFVPDGIRVARKDYFAVLAQFLRAFPLRLLRGV